jgi:hypothetical protein
MAEALLASLTGERGEAGTQGRAGRRAPDVQIPDVA